FNLLTIALCLLLIDDSAFCRGSGSLPVRTLTASPTATGALGGRALPDQLRSYAAIAVIVLTLPINAWFIFTAFKPDADWLRPLVAIYGRLESVRIANGYGLFRVMTKDRDEIVIEGSADGIDWLPYEFKWKPGDVMRAPGWCAPHQPRLDWQMWFAALETPQQNPWLVGLIARLFHGSP